MVKSVGIARRCEQLREACRSGDIDEATASNLIPLFYEGVYLAFPDLTFWHSLGVVWWEGVNLAFPDLTAPSGSSGGYSRKAQLCT